MEELKLYLNGIVCVTCLSSDRDLSLIEDIPQVQELLPNIRLNTSEDKICWECRSVLTNFTRFRKKAEEARTVLDSFVEGNLTSIKSLSDLKWEVAVDGIKIKMKDQSSRVEIQSDENDHTGTEEYSEEDVNNMHYEEIKANTDDKCTDHEFNDNENVQEFKLSAGDETMDNEYMNYGEEDDILQKFPDKFNIDDDETNKIIDMTLELYLQELTNKYNKKRSRLHVNETDAIESDHGANENEDIYIELDNFKKFDVPKGRALNRYENISRKKINKDELIQMLGRERENTCYKNAYFKCEKCVYGYDNVDQYTDHLVKHDEERGSEVCSICEQRFPDRKTAIDHYLHHFMAFYCTACGYTSRFLRFLKSHQENKECGLKKYPIWFYCDECEEKFALESLLSHHKKTIHKQEYACKYCNKTFTKDYNRKLHEQIHTGRESVQCDICHKFFANKSSFQFHLKTVHDFTPKRSVYCKVCNKFYRRKHAYHVHKRSHAAAKS